MKHIRLQHIERFIFSILILAALQGHAQIVDHVNWRAEVAPKQAKVGETVELVFRAFITKDWYIYSNDFDPNLGPMLTTFTFSPNGSYELVGEVRPIGPLRTYDSLIWKGEYSYFKGKAEFRQTVRVLAADFQVKAEVKGQVCSDVTGQCVLFEDDFTVAGLTVTEAGQQAATEESGPGEKEERAPKISPTNVSTADGGNENTANTEETIKTEGETNTLADAEASAAVKGEGNKAGKRTPRKEVATTVEGADTDFLGFLLISFLWGIAAIFTPCVFPMIPMTVSFFTGKDKKFGAVFYGLSIIGIYTLVGAVVAPLFGPAFANFISTHWLPNVLFFLVFFFFALAFFGMFELVLPTKLVNQVDRKADRGGLAGIFFMAFTLVLVSFSCTGPIVGSILVASAGGEFVKPVAGMFMFGLSFGLPFTLFALFPSWLKGLPKSGGWLNSVKVVLGFIELALAFKFLSVADQVYHWGILDRHVNIAIWIAISLAMGLYFLGYIRLPHDSPADKVSVPRLLLGIASFAFVVYLIPGMFGAPLKGLSGFLPPRSTHDFDLVALMRQQAGNTVTVSGQAGGSTLENPPKYSEFLEIPHGIEGYFDFEEGMQAAQQAGKPVFIDFTGHGCVNCRKMEANVWGEPVVLNTLKEDYVVIALYVDDRTQLPESEWVKSGYDGKIKKTIGEVNADFQIDRFGNNAQPFYVLLDHEGELLVRPVAYEPNVQKFADFLQRGLEAFAERQGELVSQ